MVLSDSYRLSCAPDERADTLRSATRFAALDVAHSAHLLISGAAKINVAGSSGV